MSLYKCNKCQHDFSKEDSDKVEVAGGDAVKLACPECETNGHSTTDVEKLE